MTPPTRRCLVYYPWPLGERTGAQAVLLAYCRSMREVGLTLDAFAPGQPAALPLEQGQYLGVFDRVFTLPHGPDAIMRMLESGATSLADPDLPAQEGRDETGMAAAAVLASIGGYDMVAVHYTRCHSLRSLLPPHVSRVLFAYDLDAVVSAQERVVLGAEHPFTVKDEVDRMRAFDLVTMIGPDDFGRARAHAPELNLVEAPFVMSRGRPSATRRTPGATMLWLSAAASFHVKSFQWFWQHVWPRIRDHRHGARLVIAGRIAGVAHAMGVADDPAVDVLGVVDDAEALMASADIMLAPYYYGDGVKIKVLEALAHGVPVVTTTRGLSNTHLVPGRDVLVADDASTYARHVIDLLASPARRDAMSAAGLAYIERHHDATHAHEPLRAALAALIAQPPRRAAQTAPSSRSSLVTGLKQLVPWAVDRCLTLGANAVAIYGAGSHTRALLPIWAASGGPAVTQIIVSTANGDAEYRGLPIVPADRADLTHVGAIVLSSQAYEHEMAAVCATRWPGLPVVPIWRPDVAPRRPNVAGGRGEGASAPTTCDAVIPGELRAR